MLHKSNISFLVLYIIPSYPKACLYKPDHRHRILTQFHLSLSLSLLKHSREYELAHHHVRLYIQTLTHTRVDPGQWPPNLLSTTRSPLPSKGWVSRRAESFRSQPTKRPMLISLPEAQVVCPLPRP